MIWYNKGLKCKMHATEAGNPVALMQPTLMQFATSSRQNGTGI